jgi:hypothetical protein
VTLISSEGISYMWSDGSETQAISVTESGEYSVDVVDQCASALSSEVITVVVLATPDTPVVDDVSIDIPGTVTFTGNTETLQWFETEMSEDELGVGIEFTTPFISTTTSYWVEDVMLHGGEQANGGLETNGEGQYHENNYNWLIFDAYEDIELVSVRVFAEGEFEREFAVFDSNNNMFESLTVNVPDGESVVELNFFIPEGADYSLECLTDEPYLWRDENEEADLAYPFDLGEIASITSSSVGGGNWNNYYYFFYDWLVQTASTECTSDRIEVIATVVSVEDIEVLNSLSVYPNPTSDILNVNFSLLQATLVQIDIVNQLGQRIISEQLIGNSAQNAVEFDLSGLARGLYHIEFSVDGQMATQKIVVE